MLIKELPNPHTRTTKLYRKARRKGISYLEMKFFMKNRYNVESSGDLTIEEYNDVRAIIRTIKKDYTC